MIMPGPKGSGLGAYYSAAETRPTGSAPVSDQPLITRPSPPRAPLAVRRATPEIPRLRSTSGRTPILDLAELDISSGPSRPIALARSPRVNASASGEVSAETAALVSRLAAVMIDLALLAIIDALVIYFTMKICGLTVEDLGFCRKLRSSPSSCFRMAATWWPSPPAARRSERWRRESRSSRPTPTAPSTSVTRFCEPRLAGAGGARRPWTADGASQLRSPRPPRSLCRHESRSCFRLNGAALDQSPRSCAQRFWASATRRWPPARFGSAAGLPDLVRASSRGMGPGVRLWRCSSSASGAAQSSARYFGYNDPGPVVVDEVMGMLVTLFLNPVSWDGVLVGFLLFRLFDIIKPYPAPRLERLHGGLGIMADDAMAAVYANLALRVYSRSELSHRSLESSVNESLI